MKKIYSLIIILSSICMLSSCWSISMYEHHGHHHPGGPDYYIPGSHYPPAPGGVVYGGAPGYSTPIPPRRVGTNVQQHYSGNTNGTQSGYVRQGGVNNRSSQSTWQSTNSNTYKGNNQGVNSTNTGSTNYKNNGSNTSTTNTTSNGTNNRSTGGTTSSTANSRNSSTTSNTTTTTTTRGGGFKR